MTDKEYEETLEEYRKRIYAKKDPKNPLYPDWFNWSAWTIELIDKYQLMELGDMSVETKIEIYQLAAAGVDHYALEMIIVCLIDAGIAVDKEDYENFIFIDEILEDLGRLLRNYDISDLKCKDDNS